MGNHSFQHGNSSPKRVHPLSPSNCVCTKLRQTRCGMALIPDSHNVHTETHQKRMFFTSFPFKQNKTRSESEPATSLCNFMHFLAPHVQGYWVAHRPPPTLVGWKKAVRCRTVDFIRAARRRGRTIFQSPGILLITCATQPKHMLSPLDWDAEPKPNQLPEGPSALSSKKKKKAPYSAEAVRRRTLSCCRRHRFGTGWRGWGTKPARQQHPKLETTSPETMRNMIK